MLYQLSYAGMWILSTIPSKCTHFNAFEATISISKQFFHTLACRLSSFWWAVRLGDRKPTVGTGRDTHQGGGLEPDLCATKAGKDPTTLDSKHYKTGVRSEADFPHPSVDVPRTTGSNNIPNLESSGFVHAGTTRVILRRFLRWKYADHRWNPSMSFNTPSLGTATPTGVLLSQRRYVYPCTRS